MIRLTCIWNNIKCLICGFNHKPAHKFCYQLESCWLRSAHFWDKQKGKNQTAVESQISIVAAFECDYYCYICSHLVCK